MPRNIVVLLDKADGRDLAKRLCRKHKVGFAEFQELVQAEIDQTGKQRKRGLWEQFDDILDRLEEAQ